jgi:hypothetical protein
MLYTFDKGSEAHAPAVEKFVSCLFEACPHRPAAIGIDKSDSERNGVQQAVNLDDACWGADKQQIAAFIQLCECVLFVVALTLPV